jgi:SNF2 family DNA or RNA helicase
MVKHNYICHTPSEYILLQNELGDDVMSLLHSGNVEEALVKLNCNVDTKENIYSLVTKKLQNKLHNAEKHLQYLKSIHPDNPEVNNKNIQTAEEGILSISTRCNTIHKNIYQMNDSLCPICYSEFNTPTLTPCCCNTFCLQCIIKSLQMNSNQCPFCRDTIDTSKLNSIQDLEAPHKKDTSAKEEVMNKLDKLVEIVTNNDQKKKILIFSCFDLKYIKVKLDELNLKNEEICGTSDHIEKVLKDYRYNRTPILLLSAKHYGSGLNLEMTTDLVIYHRLSNDLQSQVIGRAHRVGRKESLRVHQLLHSNE